jgi:hypothetical protein
MAARQLELDVTVRQRPSRAVAVLHGIVIAQRRTGRRVYAAGHGMCWSTGAG